MKTRPSRRTSSGFTLVELLVVISIIVVLAAMSLGAIGVVSKKAKNTQTLNDATRLKSALDGYYREYSRLPSFGMPSDEMEMEGQAASELLIILLGKEEVGSEMQNPRQLAFLDSKSVTNKAKGGLVFSSSSANALPEGFYDAWGKPFRLKIDDDYDGDIPDPLKQGGTIRGATFALYSYGQDGKLGEGDDIKTW